MTPSKRLRRAPSWNSSNATSAALRTAGDLGRQVEEVVHAAGGVRCPGRSDLDGPELQRDPITRGAEEARELAVAGGGVCAPDSRGDVVDGEHLGEVHAHGERALAARPLLDQRVQEAGLAEPARRVGQRAGSRAGEV